MLETMAALGIVALLLFAGLRMATLARAPGATAEAAAQLDAALALARSLARASGNGATLLALQRSDTRGNALPGFRLVLYRGRPNAPGAASLTRELPLVADASLREASLGAPPFALFFRRDGSAVALARPALSGSNALPRFAIIAAEPRCPSTTGLLLSVMRNGATVTRSIPCPVTDGGGLAAPQASMTPNPPTLAPPALLFAWPSAPVQWFAVAEFGYRGWFASTGGAMENFVCRANGAAIVAFPNSPPYSGPQSLADARSVPSPPNGVPYAYAASASASAGAMDDAPAHFPVHPIGAGLCVVPLADAFAQRTDAWGNPLGVAMRVMGWLRLAANGSTATSQTPPLSIASAPLTSGQSVTVNASKSFDNDPAGITFAGLAWNPASCGSALTFTAAGNNTAGSGPTGAATHSFLITDSVPPASALTCTGTITDQYNEPPVAFSVNVAAAAVAIKTWPAYLEVGANGAQVAATSATSGAMTIAFIPTISPTVALARNLNTWLGGGIAEAGPTPSPGPCPSGFVFNPITSKCIPMKIPLPTPASNVAPPVAPSAAPMFLGGPCYGYAKNGAGGPDTTLANGEIQIGTQYYTAASDGCINVGASPTGPFAPATSTQIGIIAYQPGDTSASTPTYQSAVQGTICSNIASLGLPYPGNAGPQVLVPVIPGSTGGSCSVTISDGSTSAPIADAGLANVSVVASVGCVVGTACGVNIVQRGLWCTPVSTGLGGYLSGYQSVETVYQSTDGGTTWTQTYTSQNSLNFGHATVCGTTVAPPLPSPPGPIMWTQNNQAYKTNGSWTPTSPPTYVTAHFG